MKIQSIEITNYKAFLGTHKIKVGGKNLFIYGENGSGKSSLYYALKDFFQSSIEDIDLNELENIFVSEKQKGKTSINVVFKPNSQGQNKLQAYLFNTKKNDTRAANDTSIRDGNRLKSFLTYKHLLPIHYLKKDDAINLFDLLVKGVLKHFKYSLTGGKELGELWKNVEETIARTTGRQYPSNKKKVDVKAALKSFNEAFGELFKPDSPEYILNHARPILGHFNHNIDLNLHYSQVRPSSDYAAIEGDEVHVDLHYAGKSIDKPHLLLNEARLSAIAISIYLGMIKRHVQRIPCKVLFLDDIFIGLDIANRLPLLNILESEFPDYQLFITTYDKPWFEYAKGVLDQKSDWKTMEFYAKEEAAGYEVPIIMDNPEFLERSRFHLGQCDYKAAAVYARSAFEKIIKDYCHKKNKKFPYSRKGPSNNDLWTAVCSDLSKEKKEAVETYRSLVLNPFSHYDSGIYEIRTELKGAIMVIDKLKQKLAGL